MSLKEKIKNRIKKYENSIMYEKYDKIEELEWVLLKLKKEDKLKKIMLNTLIRCRDHKLTYEDLEECIEKTQK